MPKLIYNTCTKENFKNATEQQRKKLLFCESPIAQLAEIAHFHEIYGTYVKYMEGCEHETSYAGLYYVCGLDEKNIRENNFDIAKLIERQRHYPLCTFTHMEAFRVDNENENYTANNIAAYLVCMDRVRYIYQMLSIPIPEVIMTATVNFLSEWLMYAESKSMYNAGKKASLSAVLACANDLAKLEDGKKIHEKYKRFCYSGRKRKFWHFDFLKFLISENPKVSYKTVMCHTVEFATITIEKSLWKDFNKMMKHYPDALYAKLPGTEGIAHIADPQKKVWRKKSDRMDKKKNPWAGIIMGLNGYNIIFPTHWGDTISFVYNQVKHKKAGGLTQDEVLSEDIYGAFLVPEKYFEDFHELCYRHHVRYAFDMGIVNRSDFSNIPILVREKDIDITHMIIRHVHFDLFNNTQPLENTMTRYNTKFAKGNKWPECKDYVSLKLTNSEIPHDFTGLENSNGIFSHYERNISYRDKKNTDSEYEEIMIL